MNLNVQSLCININIPFIFENSCNNQDFNVAFIGGVTSTDNVSETVRQSIVGKL